MPDQVVDHTKGVHRKKIISPEQDELTQAEKKYMESYQQKDPVGKLNGAAEVYHVVDGLRKGCNEDADTNDLIHPDFLEQFTQYYYQDRKG